MTTAPIDPGTRVMVYPRRQRNGLVICAAAGQILGAPLDNGDYLIDIEGGYGRLRLSAEHLEVIAS